MEVILPQGILYINQSRRRYHIILYLDSDTNKLYQSIILYDRDSGTTLMLSCLLMVNNRTKDLIT